MDNKPLHFLMKTAVPSKLRICFGMPHHKTMEFS